MSALKKFPANFAPNASEGKSIESNSQEALFGKELTLVFATSMKETRTMKVLARGQEFNNMDNILGLTAI